MDEIVDFLASNILIVALLGAFILILKIVVVYLLIKTRKPILKFSKKSFKEIFVKHYNSDDIKKSRLSHRIFLKKANNSFTLITYSWLILMVISIFLKVTVNRTNSSAPVENTQQSPTSTEE